MMWTHSVGCLSLCILVWYAGYVVTSCDLNGTPCGELLPTDPNAAIGQPLEMTCTLKEEFMTSNNCNSSDIFFTIRNVSKEKKIQVDGMAINRTTARLYLPKVNLSYGTWDVNCFIRVTTRKTKKVTYEIMYVGYLPYKPSITDVYILNWKNLVVNWSVPTVNPFIKTYHTTVYQARKMQKWSKWTNCGGKIAIDSTEQQSCTVKNIDLNIELLKVKVNANNILGSSRSEILTRELPPLVLAAPVVNLHVVAVDKRTATVTWDSQTPPDIGSKVLEYQVIYKSSNRDIHQVSFTSSDIGGISADISPLLPYNQYEVTVRCRSNKSDRWSKNSSIPVHTKEDLPEALPVVLQGNFVVKLRPANLRDVVLYWQPVPERKRNGRIRNYRLTMITETSAPKTFELDAESLNGDLSYTVKNLSVDERYNFLIEANNSVGFSHMASKQNIIIPPQNEIPSSLGATFLKLNNSSVRVAWPDPGKARSVTFYWCRSNQNHNDCQGEIKWQQQTLNSVRMIFLNGSFGEEHLFGTSVDIEGQHSGIVWTSCVYNVKAQPVPPLLEVMHTYPDKIEFRLKKGDCTVSKALIEGYVVKYCLVKSDQDQKCSGKESEQVFSISDVGWYSLQDLQPGSTYLLNVSSTSLAVHSNVVTYTVCTSNKVLTEAIVAVIVVVSILAFFLSCLGVYAVCKKQHQLCKKWKEPISISVPLEESSVVGAVVDAGEIKEYEKTPNTQIETNLIAPVQRSEWLPEPVVLHEPVSQYPSECDKEETQPLVINPKSFHQQGSFSTPLSSGSSDYAATGKPFYTLNNQPTSPIIPILMSDSMDVIRMADVQLQDDHCLVPLANAGVLRERRSHSQETESDDPEGVRSINQTSSMIIPPPHSLHAGESESGRYMGTESIDSYARADLVSPLGGSSTGKDTDLEAVCDEEEEEEQEEERDSGCSFTYVRTATKVPTFNTPLGTAEEELFEDSALPYII